MADVFAAVCARFLPARGRRRAAPAPSAEQAWGGRGALPVCRSRRVAEVFDADSLPLVPRYLVHHERAEEVRRQRDRRRALALAALGQDMPERVA